MRIIYHKKSFKVIGVIQERVTSHFPPSFVDKDSTYIDIDYDHIGVKRHPLAKYLEENKANLLEKTIIIKGDEISFMDKKEKQYMDTILIDVQKPKLDRTVRVYTKRAEEMGVKVDIDDIDSVILVKITHGDELVGTIHLTKRGCCTYVYDEGEAINRDFYPHYIGFSKLIEYLAEKKSAKWIDLFGFVEKDPELTRFKKKWGEEKKVEVTWQ